MRIIIPMAGIGKRLRPHTLYTPKPLLPIAGKPIVERLVDEIMEEAGNAVEEIAFIVGAFGDEVEQQLVKLAESKGARGTIYHQPEALGTAHALSYAADSLSGEVIIAFADTLFKADFKLDHSKDAIIWTKEVDDPRAFGVVELDGGGQITSFVEKPQDPQSNQAIIGIYYIREGEKLRAEIEHIVAHNITDKGEYQLTTCLDNMRANGAALYTASVDLWLDCGNKQNMLDTNRQILDLLKSTNNLISKSAKLAGSSVIEPCYIGDNVRLTNSQIGPHVSIGEGTTIENSVLKNSIIQDQCTLVGQSIVNSMIGNQVTLVNKGNSAGARELSVGDFSTEKVFE